MLERIVRIVDALVLRTLVVGAGRLPEGMREAVRVFDRADCGTGPLAGILTAIRTDSRACWVVVACDMPEISADAVEWLLGERAPGRWAVMPQSAEGHVEPLFAVYEPLARSLLEDSLARGRLDLRAVAASGRVHTPLIPPELKICWTNINRPEDLDRANIGEPLPKSRHLW